jgi:hypothetical protein
MNSEKKKIEHITGGNIRYVLIDNLGYKNYFVETEENYIKCQLVENELIIIEEYLTEEEWRTQIT